ISAPTATPAAPSGFVLGSTQFNVTLTDSSNNALHQLSHPLLITFPYTAADLSTAGGDVSRILVQFFDSGTSSWNTLTIVSSDTLHQTVTAQVNHLSLFALTIYTGPGSPPTNTPTSVPAGGPALYPGFNATDMGPNDDSSTAAIPMGLSINFGGHSYNSAYVNNNGNLTFASSNSTYTPFALGSFGNPILAPFWADVNTNQGNTVHY